MGKIRVIKQYVRYNHYDIDVDEEAKRIRSEFTPEEAVKYLLATEGIRKAGIKSMASAIVIEIKI